MRLLVTGAAGFIGSNFVRMVATGKIEGISSVAVLDKLTYAGVKDNLLLAQDISKYTFTEGDICDSKLVTSMLEDVDGVINFAAGWRIAVTWPLPIISRNVKENMQNKFFIKQKLNIQPNGCTFVINLQTVLWI